MSDIGVVKELARQMLLVSGSESGSDEWLWDRTERIVRNCESICRIPEVDGANLAVDRFCLMGSAYFSESGFAVYDNIDDSAWRVVLSEINASDLRKFSAEAAAEKLTGEIADSKVEKISNIIIESNSKGTELIEAQILSDARGLEDMGAVGIFNEFRKYTVHGQSVADALVGWERKIDYRYWEARLNESIKFDSVRKVAKRRFDAAEVFMNQLVIENLGRDLSEEIIEELG